MQRAGRLPPHRLSRLMLMPTSAVITCAKALGDGLAPGMPAAADQLLAVHPDAIDLAAIGEDPGVEDGVAASCRQARDGSASSETKSAAAPAAIRDGPAPSAGAAAVKRRVEQRAPGRAAGHRQHIAGAVREALRIFELAQFVGQADQHVGIRADAEAAAMLR